MWDSLTPEMIATLGGATLMVVAFILLAREYR